MNSVPIVLIAILFFTLAYRYYSAFLAAKVLTLDDLRRPPAVTMNDGRNYSQRQK